VMSEISYKDLGILTIQSLLDSTIKDLRQIEQTLDDGFNKISEDLIWGGAYGIPVRMPSAVTQDYPQLDNEVAKSAWMARESCNSLLNWLIEGGHERVIPLEQATAQECSDRIDKIDKQITQDIKDKKNEAVYDCAEVYCLVEGLKAEVAERDRTIAKLEKEKANLDNTCLIWSEHLEKQLAKERDLITKIELLQNRLNNFPRIDYGVQGKLKEIQKHLISLEVDLELLGSWTKDWMKADYSDVLTHAQKCYLSKQKVSQVKYLTAIIEKLLGTCEVSSEF